MISELSPGDKLSLKGKIFELRKKLTEVDVEQQRAEEYSFRPQISFSEHHERDGDFLQSIERAELMRKQKLQLLKATLIEEDKGKCTFQPVITKYRMASDSEKLPVHLRLQEKGKQYYQRQSQRVEKGKLYDSDGRRMFQPLIPQSAGDIEGKDAGNKLSADEYLYRDARNREIRMHQRIIEAHNESLSEVNSVKLNRKSTQLLKRRAEREIRSIFEFLDVGNNGELSFRDLREGMECLLKLGQVTRSSMLQFTDKLWVLLDRLIGQGGKIEFSTFLGLCLEAKKCSASIRSIASNRTEALTAEDSKLLHFFISNMLTVVQEREASFTQNASSVDISFQPGISDRSKLLAEQKAMREPSSTSSFDKLLARGKEVIQKKEALRESLLRQEMSECTFHPHRVTENYVIQTSQNSNKPAVVETIGDGNSSDEASDDEHDSYEPTPISSHEPESTFNRLYKLKDKPIIEKHQHSSITELQACTFKPVVDRSTMNLPTASHTPCEMKSVEKSVMRMQKARQLRKQEQDFRENMGQVDAEKYAKSRSLLAAGPVPFNFHLEQRRQLKDQRQEQTRKPRLYVDVKLGPNRTVNIAVADGDHPALLAEQFCKIYSLDNSACAILTQVVHDSMIANGIVLGNSLAVSASDVLEADEEGSPSPGSASPAGPEVLKSIEPISDTLQLRKPVRRRTVFRESEDITDGEEAPKTAAMDTHDNPEENQLENDANERS